QALAQSHRQCKPGVQRRCQRSQPCRNPLRLRESREGLSPPQRSPTDPHQSIVVSDNQYRHPASASNPAKAHSLLLRPSKLPSSSRALPKRQPASLHFVSRGIVRPRRLKARSEEHTSELQS